VYWLVRRFLFCLDAERAHALGLEGLEAAYRSGFDRWLLRSPAPLPTRAFGIEFPNPVGLAAGLDKDGAHVDALAALGFGFLEVGTTTPRPQAGNPKPRLWRLPSHAALINRLGFNNAGVEVLVRNLEKTKFAGVLGINIGKNHDTPLERAADDYRLCLERVYARASYVTVNVSSPNTSGLRDLQREAALRRLLGELGDARERLATQHGARKPMLLKLAPDLTEAELDGLADVVRSAAIDGLILTNTTIDRSRVAGARHAEQQGGLSGKPLFDKATAVLRGMRARLGESMPLIGVGGILCGADAVTKIDAGANLVQCYTGLVYRGPKLIGECVEALRARRRDPQ
jgi:dihydroorotate dehydrogenase